MFHEPNPTKSSVKHSFLEYSGRLLAIPYPLPVADFCLFSIIILGSMPIYYTTRKSMISVPIGDLIFE